MTTPQSLFAITGKMVRSVYAPAKGRSFAILRYSHAFVVEEQDVETNERRELNIFHFTPGNSVPAFREALAFYRSAHGLRDSK